MHERDGKGIQLVVALVDFEEVDEAYRSGLFEVVEILFFGYDSSLIPKISSYFRDLLLAPIPRFFCDQFSL